MGDLIVGTRVADGGGHSADALLIVDDVVDEGAYVSVKLGGDGVVRGCSHVDVRC